jgi:hypothetical protein
MSLMTGQDRTLKFAGQVLLDRTETGLRFKKVCNKIELSAKIHNGTVFLCTVMCISRWFDFVTEFYELEVNCLLSRSTAITARRDIFFSLFQK